MLYGGRLTKGKVKQTPEGPAFGIKPLFAWARAVVLPAYLLFFVYLLAGKPHETLYVGSTSDLVRKEHKGRHRRSGFFSYAALAD